MKWNYAQRRAHQHSHDLFPCPSNAFQFIQTGNLYNPISTISICIILLLHMANTFSTEGRYLLENGTSPSPPSHHHISSSETIRQDRETITKSIDFAKLNYDSNKFFHDENLSYRVAVFLAQEEAKCLEEFGGRENKTMEYVAFVPFKCSIDIAASTFDQCEMCRNLTNSLRKIDDECKSFCTKEDNFCFTRCTSIRRESQTLLEESSYEDEAMHETFQSQHQQRDSSSRKGSFDNDDVFILEEPKVFCEDVESLDESVDDKTEHFSTKMIDTKKTLFVEPFSPFPTSNDGFSNVFGSHVLYLKWRLTRKNGKHQNSQKEKTSGIVIENDTNIIEHTNSISNDIRFPVVFLLEYQSAALKSDDWILLGKKFMDIEKIQVPYHTQWYRWRVTAVGPNGVIDRAFSKDFFQTLDGFVEPGPPTKIAVAKEIVGKFLVDVLIRWVPPAERPCAYKINLYSMDTSELVRTHRLTEPLGVNLHVFKGLKFGAKYEVTMTSRGDNWSFESTLKSQNFTSITCLAAHSYRFDKCDPLPPRNITHTFQNANELQKDERKGKLIVKLSWLPPLYASKTNPISNYIVSFGPPLNESAANHKNLLNAAFFPMNQKMHNIAGNITQIYLDELLQNAQYVIKLTAVSTKGKSQPIQYHFSTKLGKEENHVAQSSNWLYLSISISCLILALFGCHFTRVFVHKRKVKQARNEYFQTMEERDVISADWSIVPLNEDYYSLNLFGDCPKEKWEIGYDKLLMGDVIGQGAFGVVRRATMAKKNIRFNGEKKLEKKYNQDAEEMQTVAVKMLKVSATRDDREQLIKEIVTMQNLGCHPQIVSLLGACTKGRSLCLILEYCPGGDLLTFLRKVRARYWPTLGLSDSARSQSGFFANDNARRSNIPESSRASISSRRKSTDSSPINYADIETCSDYSSSPDKITTSMLHEYGNTPGSGQPPKVMPPPGVDIDDDCRPLDEKDVLSYARQVAMGMEYLEKNHIVHRDLAGRNVLLLGDYKQIMISDFGLSRDVYTWNVYHQKSNGKLPIKWMAIESIFTHVFTSKSDVWSYGILLWELVTLGGTPYPGLGNTELFSLLKSGYRMERPDNCSEELYALMKKCWRTASGSRPNFTELRHHVETMMEAAEPSLYLSLMADLPTDYFHISSRNDLIHTRLEGSLEESNTTKENPNVRASNSSSSLKNSIHGSTNTKRKPSKAINGPNNFHDHHHEHEANSTKLQPNKNNINIGKSQNQENSCWGSTLDLELSRPTESQTGVSTSTHSNTCESQCKQDYGPSSFCYVCHSSTNTSTIALDAIPNPNHVEESSGVSSLSESEAQNQSCQNSHFHNTIESTDESKIIECRDNVDDFARSEGTAQEAKDTESDEDQPDDDVTSSFIKNDQSLPNVLTSIPLNSSQHFDICSSGYSSRTNSCKFNRRHSTGRSSCKSPPGRPTFIIENKTYDLV